MSTMDCSRLGQPSLMAPTACSVATSTMTAYHVMCSALFLPDCYYRSVVKHSPASKNGKAPLRADRSSVSFIIKRTTWVLRKVKYVCIWSGRYVWGCAVLRRLTQYWLTTQAGWLYQLTVRLVGRLTAAAVAAGSAISLHAMVCQSTANTLRFAWGRTIHCNLPGDRQYSTLLPENRYYNTLLAGGGKYSALLPGDRQYSKLLSGDGQYSTLLPGDGQYSTLLSGDGQYSALLPGDVQYNTLLPGDRQYGTLLPSFQKYVFVYFLTV